MPSELILECLEFVFEIGHIQLPALYLRQLPLVLQALPGSLHQKRDYRNEKLGTDDIHLRVAVRDIDYTAVVQVTLGLQQRHQHGELAALLSTVLIQFLEKILIFVLRRCSIHLVLHLEHDGHILLIAFKVTEDKVALRPFGHLIVLFKVC